MNQEVFQDFISRGISLMASENYTAAKEAFKSAIDQNNRSVEAYTHLGNACANLGQYDEALTAFKNSLVVNPDFSEAYYSIGNIYLLQDERLKAVESYNRAEAAGFEKSELYQIMATIFFEAGDEVQALRNLTKAIALSPFDGKLRIFKAQIYMHTGKFEQAIETLDEMEHILPDAYEAYDIRTQIYCGLEKFEEALRVCEKGCSRFPEDVNLTLLKLKTLVEMQNDELAFAFLVEMKANGQYNKILKETAIQESILYLRKHDVETAVKVLSAADAALQGDIDVQYVLLEVYGNTEQYQKVLELSTKLMEMHPPMVIESNAKYFHAHALDKLGKEVEAKAEYKQLTSLFRKYTTSDPSFYEGYIYRLLCHTNLAEYEEALRLSDYLENVFPERVDAHAFRYHIYKAQGDMEKAEEEKRIVAAINPDMRL